MSSIRSIELTANILANRAFLTRYPHEFDPANICYHCGASLEDEIQSDGEKINCAGRLLVAIVEALSDFGYTGDEEAPDEWLLDKLKIGWDALSRQVGYRDRDKFYQEITKVMIVAGWSPGSIDAAEWIKQQAHYFATLREHHDKHHERDREAREAKKRRWECPSCHRRDVMHLLDQNRYGCFSCLWSGSEGDLLSAGKGGYTLDEVSWRERAPNIPTYEEEEEEGGDQIAIVDADDTRSCYTCDHFGICHFRRSVDEGTRHARLNIDTDELPGKMPDILIALGRACYEYKPNDST